MTPDYITTAEAMRISGYTADYLRTLLRDGKIEGQKWGREWQVSRASLLVHVQTVQKIGAKRGPKRES